MTSTRKFHQVDHIIHQHQDKGAIVMSPILWAVILIAVLLAIILMWRAVTHSG